MILDTLFDVVDAEDPIVVADEVSKHEFINAILNDDIPPDRFLLSEEQLRQNPFPGGVLYILINLEDDIAYVGQCLGHLNRRLSTHRGDEPKNGRNKPVHGWYAAAKPMAIFGIHFHDKQE